MGWERGRASQSFHDLLPATRSKQHIVAVSYSHSLSPSTITTANDASFLSIFPVLPTLILKHKQEEVA